MMVLWKQNGDEIFEVEIVLLHTLWVKRNVGRGTPTKYLLILCYKVRIIVPPVSNGRWYFICCDIATEREDKNEIQKETSGN